MEIHPLVFFVELIINHWENPTALPIASGFRPEDDFVWYGQHMNQHESSTIITHGYVSFMIIVNHVKVWGSIRSGHTNVDTSH